jgi:hypothetical protein
MTAIIREHDPCPRCTTGTLAITVSIYGGVLGPGHVADLQALCDACGWVIYGGWSDEPRALVPWFSMR